MIRDFQNFAASLLQPSAYCELRFTYVSSPYVYVFISIP